MSESDTIANFVASHDYHDLPPSCVELARRGILDAIGCGLYGASLSHVDWIRQATVTGAGECQIWGHRLSARAEDAALVNGTAVHATEMAETFIRAVVHPGNVIVPAAVAVAESLDCTGEQLLTAVTLAYEVLARCGLAAGVATLMEQRLHTFSLLGVFGSAVAAAKLRFGDDETRIADALGIAASFAPTTLFDASREGATIKDVFEGHAATVGVMAASYAGLGITGPRAWAREWFPAVVRKPNLGRLTEGLGQRWEMDSGGLRIKMRPVMGLVQPTIAAVLDLLDRHQIDPADVARIEVDSTRRADIAAEQVPVSVTGAKASIPFTVAALLTKPAQARRDPFMLGFYREAMLRDPEILRLARLCTVAVDDEFEYNFETAPVMKYESRVTITGTDGRTYEGYADIWPATSGLSFADIEGKFLACARRSLPAAQAMQVYQTVRELESMASVRALTRQLAPADG